jgi:hypothetical protein
LLFQQALCIMGDPDWCSNLDVIWKQHPRKCNAGDLVISPCSKLLVEP